MPTQIVKKLQLCKTIVAAWETLGHPVKRKSYDSVDPLFDDSTPPNNAQSKENFFAVFKPVFDRNARFIFNVFLLEFINNQCGITTYNNLSCAPSLVPVLIARFQVVS